MITYLANRPLTAKLEGGLRVLETTALLEGFFIGSGTGAGTISPVSWYDGENNTAYWDCPGFNDPRGNESDIVNAFSIHELFKEPSRVKLVLRN